MENKINYLIDTNVWLERLLNQEQSEIVGELLEVISSEYLSISDFTLHSIGVILAKFEKHEVYIKFINDLFVNGEVSCINLEPIENIEVIQAIESKGLDFDDSYQYVLKEKYELQLVTFDKDFKKKGIKTLTPKEAVERYIKRKK